MRDDYRAKWEAFISWAVKEFDRRVGETMAAGEKVMVTTKVDDYRTAGIGQDGGSSPIIRAVTFNGVELRLYCASAQVQPGRLSAGGGLTITVRDLTKPDNYSNPLSLTFDLDRASVGKLTVAASISGSSQYDALMGPVVAGINQGIQDLLVVGRAHVR